MAGKPLSKAQLIGHLADKAGKKKSEVSEMLDLIVNTAYDEVKSKGVFNFPGLGKLVKRDRAARQGRNPATGETIQIPAKTVVKFRVAKAAKEAIL